MLKHYPCWDLYCEIETRLRGCGTLTYMHMPKQHAHEYVWHMPGKVTFGFRCVFSDEQMAATPARMLADRFVVIAGRSYREKVREALNLDRLGEGEGFSSGPPHVDVRKSRAGEFSIRPSAPVAPRAAADPPPAPKPDVLVVSANDALHMIE